MHLVRSFNSVASATATKARTAGGRMKAWFSTALGTAMALPAVAFAQAADLGDAAQAQLTGAQGIVLGILITLVGIVFLFVVYSLIKRARA